MFYGASDPKPVESSSIRLAGPSVCRRGGVKPRYMMAIDRGGANVRGLTGTDHPLQCRIRRDPFPHIHC